MPITVACACGKKFKTKDENAGKKGRCPECGAALTIPGGSAPAVARPAAAAARPAASSARPAPAKAPAPARAPVEDGPPDLDDILGFNDPPPAAPQRLAPAPPLGSPSASSPSSSPAATKASAAPASPFPSSRFPPGVHKVEHSKRVDIPKGPIIAILVVVVVVGGIIWVMKHGPAKAAEEWRKLQPKVESDAVAVVNKALRGYYASKGYHADDIRRPPESKEIAVTDMVVTMTVPKEVMFNGRSSEGSYTGSYTTATGEVDAQVEIMTDGVMLHVTGRVKDEKFVTAEINGKPAPDLVASGKANQE